MRYEVAGYDPIRGESWIRDTTKPHGEDFVCYAGSGHEACRRCNDLNRIASPSTPTQGERA